MSSRWGGHFPAAVPSSVEVVDALLAAPARLGAVRVLAVDGPSGAGKTTFAAEVAGELRARQVDTVVVPTDHFATWAEPVSWWPRLVDGVLNPLAGDTPGCYRAVEWSSGQPRPGSWVRVPVPAVLVLEGVSAGRASVRPLLSLLCWMHMPDERARLECSVGRDGEAERVHLREWQHFERGWFAVDNPAACADSHVVKRYSVSD